MSLLLSLIEEQEEEEEEKEEEDEEKGFPGALQWVLVGFHSAIRLGNLEKMDETRGGFSVKDGAKTRHKILKIMKKNSQQGTAARIELAPSQKMANQDQFQLSGK